MYGPNCSMSNGRKRAAGMFERSIACWAPQLYITPRWASEFHTPS